MAGLESLRARVRAIEGGGVDFGREAAALGGPLDAALPWGGLPYRALHEVGGLAATGAVAAFARRFLDRGGALVWCRDPKVAAELGEPYGPGLARFGLDPERMILVRCGDQGEVLWSFEEALRCRGVACAVAELGPRGLDLLASRRLQLAAEAGGGAGLALRPGEPDPSPNAALTRWLAEPLAAPGAAAAISWCLTLWRAKGGSPGAWAVRWDERALSFAPAAGTAGPAPAVQDAPERHIVLTG
jgi:protein ImuA